MGKNNKSIVPKKNKNILTPSSTLLGARASMETDETKVVSGEELIHWPTDESQSRSLAEKEFYAYLLYNIMPFDIPNAHTLGFSASDVSSIYLEEAQTKSESTLHRRTERTATKSKVPLPDGLSNGIIEPTIQIALDAKSNPKFKAWTKDIPKSIYLEYVLPYAVLNEARTNWRSLINETLYEHVVVEGLSNNTKNENDDKSPSSVEDVVQKINQVLWGAFYSNQSDNNNNNKQSIHFKAGQTPLIYDPMSIILFGYASCTGLSIMLVDALRTFGIPARLVGTNAWNGKVKNGNHSWVEFYSPSQGKWVFLEPIVEYDQDKYNPCDFWFCNKEKFDGKTQVFAARFDRSSESSINFPIAWDNINMDVIGEDRSEYYNQICSQC